MTEKTIPSGLIANTGIELLTYGTPNGFKISILLEELKSAYSIPYTTQSINIFANEQKAPWYTSLNPSGKIPIIIDHDAGKYVITESLAIMSYLAVKYDTEFMFHFEDVLEACTCEQWLAWQHGSLAPTQGQANAYYRFLPERHAFSTQRFVAELERYYTVLDTHLEAREYVAGPGQAGKYSIADIAIWPSVDAMAVAGLELANYSHVERWWARIGEREAVKRGMRVPSGEDFAFGVESMRRFEREDREGWDGRERPLVEALERARKEFS